MSTSSSADTPPDPSWAKPFFEGKRVLISGATSGIGQGLAAAFAGAGASVMATGATAAEVKAAPAHDGVSYFELNVTDNAAVSAFVKQAGQLDVLVNCAGINRRVGEFDADTFANVVDVNLNGTMRMCEAAHDNLKDGGTILNIASMYTFFGAAHAPGYAASKGGVAQLTKSFAAAWAADGIRVNALAPGWIETPMTAPLRADAARYETISARTPMGRWGHPGDLAGAALFLCSPAAGFVTGVILPVDGGYLIA